MLLFLIFGLNADTQAIKKKGEEERSLPETPPFRADLTGHIQFYFY